MPTRSELKPFRTIAEVAMMLGVEQEQDTIKLFAWFDSLIRIRTSDRLMQAQFTRLLTDGATGREMTIRAMTVAALQMENFGGRPDLGRGELTPENLRAALGNQMLRATPIPTRCRTPGKKAQEVQVSGRVCLHIGDAIHDLHAFGALRRLWQRCLTTYEQARGDHLCDLFKPMPVDPSQPRELRARVAAQAVTPSPGNRKHAKPPPPATPSDPYRNPMPICHDADGLPQFESPP